MPPMSMTATAKDEVHNAIGLGKTDPSKDQRPLTLGSQLRHDADMIFTNGTASGDADSKRTRNF